MTNADVEARHDVTVAVVREEGLGFRSRGLVSTRLVLVRTM
jgi:hypothetical protein